MPAATTASNNLLFPKTPGSPASSPSQVGSSWKGRDFTDQIRFGYIRSISQAHARKKNTLVLDNLAIMRAFRLIGSVNGVEEKHLRSALLRLTDSQTRKELEKNLHAIFLKYDADHSGTIDAAEFEHMIRNSTLLEKAVYQLLEMEDDEIERRHASADQDSVLSNQRLEVASSAIIMLNIVVMAISTDNSPTWLGWQAIEMLFVFFFSFEIFTRMKETGSMRSFCKSKMNCFDVMITVLAAIDVAIALMQEFGISKFPALSTLTMLRVFRLVRLGRLVKIIVYHPELALLVKGVLTGIRGVIWCMVVLLVLAFLWAVFIRTSLQNQWMPDDEGMVKGTFQNIPGSTMVMFRCLTFRAEGACMDDSGVPLFKLLTADSDASFGVLFQIAWVLSEVFAFVGVLNAVASIFVVQALRHDQEITQDAVDNCRVESTDKMRQLDKLLRTLTHPQRESISVKDRNVATVSSYIQTDYPDVAAKIPNLSKTLLSFAEQIQESQYIHNNAMDKYEANEVEPCKELFSLPCAQMYLVNGEETLLVDSTESLGGCAGLGLKIAPAGAPEVVMLQESTELDVLIDEAKELQGHVKSHLLEKKKLADGIEDPGPKGKERAQEKVDMKYKGMYQRNRDYCRLGLVYDSVGNMMKAFKILLGWRIEHDGLQIARIENRFTNPTRTGWRDVQILMKAQVPSTGKYHLMEWQLNLRGLAEVRDNTHGFYETIRELLPEEAVNMIIDQLTNNTTLDLGITKREWIQCLQNKKVWNLLDELKVPRQLRWDIIDIIDSDGSGTVSSAELRHGLRLCTLPLQAGPVIDCTLKVRDMQQSIKTKLEPQLDYVQGLMLKRGVSRFKMLEEMILQELLPKVSSSPTGGSSSISCPKVDGDHTIATTRSAVTYSGDDFGGTEENNMFFCNDSPVNVHRHNTAMQARDGTRKKTLV